MVGLIHVRRSQVATIADVIAYWGDIDAVQCVTPTAIRARQTELVIATLVSATWVIGLEVKIRVKVGEILYILNISTVLLRKLIIDIYRFRMCNSNLLFYKLPRDCVPS